MTADLETLLRESGLQYGRISLDRNQEGRWYAAVSHFHSHMAKDCRTYGDPVDALRGALIEDARLTKDKVRKYRNAPKLGGWKEKGDFPVIEVGREDDGFESLLGDEFEGLL